MKPLGDPQRHIQLVNGMAQAMGVDLAAAAATDKMSQKQYAKMVTRCRSCEDPDGCEARLRRPNQTADAPGYCRNAETLAKLAI